MKIRSVKKNYEEVVLIPPKKHLRPKKQNIFFRTLLKAASAPDLKTTGFKARFIDMDRLGKNEPCLVLMNHSSFIDLKIASSVLYPRPFNIVCTYDGFVGKEWLMRNLGCIPTNKFVTDSVLVRDMMYALKTLKSSVLMYPEATYTFDGSAAPLPSSLGKCLKIFGVPVVFIRTYGAFARDPLYNELRLRKVNVSADVKYILSPEDIAKKTPDELNDVLSELFSFDNFRWQQENGVKITENSRAEGLNRILYKCPHCLTEGKMRSGGTEILCENCGKKYELTELGFLKSSDGDEKFNHIPDWYRWERECVKNEIMEGKYCLDVPVEIRMLVNTDCLYEVGEGRLIHDSEGFHLTGCDGKIDYRQKPSLTYSIYSDFFWYEIGDVIAIGNNTVTYYCFPQNAGDVVAKTRLAAEELYKLAKENNGSCGKK